MIGLIAPLCLIAALASDSRPTPVVVSTDCGAEVDDQWALAHLALSPEVALKGVVTTHAPGVRPLTAEASAKVAREVFAKMKVAAPPPIAAGSSEPLKADGKPRDNAGVQLLIEAAKGHSADDRLTVVMIGAATDVASALLIDPTWADRVRIVAMAFDGWPEGGDPWNVKNDVRAWQVVMDSRVPLVVGDATITRKRLIQTVESAKRFADRGPRGAYLVGLLEAFVARAPKMVESVSGRAGAWPIWDEVVVAYLLGMTEQEERPRPSLRNDRTLDHSRPRGRITWITAIDADRLWNDLAAKLADR
jgi:purine nucleosidase